MKSSHTNWSEFFDQCELDPARHELWWMDATPTKYQIDFSDDKKLYFILSNEGSTINLSRGPNRYFFDCVYDDKMETAPFMLHFFTALHANQYMGSSEQLRYDHTSGLIFDALMGIKRPHREFAYHWFQLNPKVADKGIITYYRNSGNYQGFLTDLPISKDFKHSVDKVPLGPGTNISYSHVIPLEVYQRTWITVVFETNEWPKGWSHFTEKVAKPMITKRPFVVLANQGYLRRLRSLGFKTFDPVIDESYDSVEDDIERWAMALEQLSRLVEKGRQQVLGELEPALEHNRSFIDKDWFELTRQRIKQLV